MTGSGSPTRDQKVENLILNYSMIVMSTFEEMFASLAAKLADTMGEITQTMGEAMTGTGSGTPPRERRVETKVPKVGPQVSAEVKKAFAQLRAEARSQLSMKDKSFKEFVRNPALDGGVKIVEKYDFRLPKLTEQLSDEDFASYVLLIRKENHELAKMLGELGEWQKGVPKPWKERG